MAGGRFLLACSLHSGRRDSRAAAGGHAASLHLLHSLLLLIETRSQTAALCDQAADADNSQMVVAAGDGEGGSLTSGGAGGTSPAGCACKYLQTPLQSSKAHDRTIG